jgi:O-acetyl-ADP-ribose deacetylase (regulator of RNase III)
MAIEIHLCTLDSAMARAWSSHFGSQPNVWIHEGDILANKADAILSPANSFGFMDGGIDLAYSHFFGWDLQDRLQETLRREHAGELPVGGAVIVPTHHASIPFLISAPTMRVPDNIADTVNVYLAFRAALLAIKASKGIRSLLSPALGTGVGSMPIERAARQMYAAYVEVVLGEGQWRSSARGVLQHHARLLS